MVPGLCPRRAGILNPPLGLGSFFNLEHFGFGLGLDPSRLFGEIRLRAGGFVKINGKGVFALPSARTPYFQRSEVGNGFPEQLYKSPFSRLTVAGGGNIGTDIPIVGQTTLANGYFAIEDPGYAAFGGGMNLGIPDVVTLEGAVAGEYDVTKPAYNLHGDIRACIHVIKKICAGSTAHTSRGPNLAWGHRRLRPARPGLDRRRHPVGAPASHLADRRLQVVAVRHQGARGPCRSDKRLQGHGEARRSQPGREADRSRRRPARAGGRPRRTDAELHRERPRPQPGEASIRILRYAGSGSQFTVVGLQNAQPGTYTISTLPGSVPVTETSTATDQPRRVSRPS